MQVLSQDNLAGNAFRVLGLPADAGQAAIDAAARRMRIWVDPAQVPPTAWDVPWLGPVRRSRRDVESAVARLTDPVARLTERMFWFGVSDGVAFPPGQVLGRMVNPAAGHSPSGQHACALHDTSLARLTGAIIADPEARSPQRWGAALADFCDAVRSPAYRQWFLSTEKNGNFEKNAGYQEVLAAVDGLAGSICESLATRARDALDHDRADVCTRLAYLLRTARPDAALLRRLDTGICDRIEDLLASRCRRLQNDLFRNIRWEQTSATAAARANRATCKRVAKEIEQSVDPLFEAFSDFQTLIGPGSDVPERMKRVGVPASGMFRNLGLGWGRVGQKRKAARALRRAAGTTDNREMAAKVKADLADLKKGNTRSGAVAIAVVIIALVRGLSGISQLPSHDGDRYKLPNLRELEHEREILDRQQQPWMPPPQADIDLQHYLQPPSTQPAFDIESILNPTTLPADNKALRELLERSHSTATQGSDKNGHDP